MDTAMLLAKPIYTGAGMNRANRSARTSHNSPATKPAIADIPHNKPRRTASVSCRPYRGNRDAICSTRVASVAASKKRAVYAIGRQLRDVSNVTQATPRNAARTPEFRAVGATCAYRITVLPRMIGKLTAALSNAAKAVCGWNAGATWRAWVSGMDMRGVR